MISLVGISIIFFVVVRSKIFEGRNKMILSAESIHGEIVSVHWTVTNRLKCNSERYCIQKNKSNRFKS